jgi:outer membrane protein assembly factor BamB
MFFSCLLGTIAGAATAADRPEAKRVLEEAGVRAGLAVVVGTTDGALEAELTNGGRMLVQGLALSNEAAAKARQHIFQKELYGLASVSVVQSVKELPYYDRLVNLLVADLDALGKDAPTKEEVGRVLGYEGVAYLKREGRWAKTVKPTPSDVDTWGHVRRSAARNAASQDRVVGPPNAARWIGVGAGRTLIDGPRTSDGVFIQYATHHNEAGGGRRAYGDAPAPPTGFFLWARDVNSGVLLWKRKVSEISTHAFSHNSHIGGDLVVAAGGRVYAYNLAGDPEQKAALTAFDIRTGEIQTVFDESVVLSPQIDERSKRVTWPRELPGKLRYSTIAVEDGKVIQHFDQVLYVHDAGSGKMLWKKESPVEAAYRQVVAGEGLVIALRATRPKIDLRDCVYPVALECYRLADGQPVWTFKDFEPDLGVMNDLLGLHNGLLPLAGAKRDDGSKGAVKEASILAMLDARKGTVVWKKPLRVFGAGMRHLGLARMIGNEFRWGHGGGTGLDARTGEQTDTWRGPANRGCSACCSTPLYDIWQKVFHPLPRGEATGSLAHYALRVYNPTCAETIAPSYGSSYALFNTCPCEVWLPGGPQAFYAVPPVRLTADEDRLHKPARSPALGELPRQTAARAAVAAAEWQEPRGVFLWSTRLYTREIPNTPGVADKESGKVWNSYRLDATPPVPAGDLTLTAYVHEHRLAATRDGKAIWNFVAGGRISAPPVIHQGLALLGSHDGHVYAVNLKDGTLAWRFLAAPADRRHVAIGQVESVWPVFNVVLHEGKAYCAAGRHTDLDGGITVSCLDPAAGALRWRTRYLRGLSTDKHTPLGERYGGDPWTTYGLNDQIAIADNKVTLRPNSPVPNATFVLADIANPRDTIINPETLMPPWLGPQHKPATDVASLNRALDDSELAYRLGAAWKLGEMGERAKPATPALAKLLAAPDAATRLVAIRALVKIGVAESLLSDLLVAAADADADLREAAGIALGAVGPASVPGLTKLLDHGDPAVARDAARALGRIAAPLDAAVVPKLLPLLKAEIEETRRLCRESAGKHRDAKIAAAHHHRVLGARTLRSLLVQALAHTGEPGQKAMADLAREGDDVTAGYARAVERAAAEFARQITGPGK